MKLLEGNSGEHLFLYTHEKEFAKESDLFYFSIKDKLQKRKLKGITNKEYKNSTFAKKSKYLTLKCVETPLPGYIDICNDKVLYVSWRKPVLGVLIHSKDIAENMEKYFTQVWETS
jgi:hypothetical protein